MNKVGKVVIFGAGVSGLTVAHMLAPYAESIDIYEKNSSAGGLARTEGNDVCNTKEVSWRVYFHFYKHLLTLMQEIPSYDAKPVSDHLVKYYNIFIPNISPITIFYANQLWSIIRTFALSDNRIDSYDEVAWRNFIGSDSAEIPQWLGMDRFKGSTTSVFRIGIEQFMRKGDKYDYVLDGPTNKVWFDPWVNHLQKRGVKFHFNSQVKKVSVDPVSKEITEVCISQGDTQESLKCIKSDIYVLALPIEQIANLVPSLVPNAKRLSDMSKQIQLAFQLHLKPDESGNVISIGKTGNGSPINSFLVRDSPWALIVESKTISWDQTLIKPCPTVQWSITVCQANVPGTYVNKPLMNCTEEEAKNEIINQLINNKYLMEHLQRENPKLDIVDTIKTAIWSTTNESTIMSTYKLGEKLQTDEPKFSNNAGTKKIRPTIDLGPNAFLASAYVKETIDIFSMEAAAIAGKLVSAKILNKFGNKGMLAPELPPRPFPFLEIFRVADEVLYKWGLPDIITVIMILVLTLIVTFLIIYAIQWIF